MDYYKIKYYINICIKMFSILLCIYSIVFILIFIISDIIYLISYCKSLYNIDYSSIIFNCIVYLLFLFNIGFISILCLINISKLLNCTKCNTAITHKKHSMDIKTNYRNNSISRKKGSILLLKIFILFLLCFDCISISIIVIWSSNALYFYNGLIIGYVSMYSIFKIYFMLRKSFKKDV